MRFLKVIVLGLMAVFALAAGLFVAVAMAALTALRLLTGRPRSSGRRPPPPAARATPHAAPREPATVANTSEVIDVVAHEVPATSDPHAR